MPFSESVPDSPIAIEAPHESYIRWATEFGLIEWVVDDNGDVYFTTPDCGHDCCHSEDDVLVPVAAPPFFRMTNISKQRMAGRLATTAAVAVLGSMGVHSAAFANAFHPVPEEVYNAASGETLVVRGNHVEVIPADKDSVKTRTVSSAPAGPTLAEIVAGHMARVANRETKISSAPGLAFKALYKDHREHGKRTVMKTAKRTHINKVAPKKAVLPPTASTVAVLATQKATPAPPVEAPGQVVSEQAKSKASSAKVVEAPVQTLPEQAPVEAPTQSAPVVEAADTIVESAPEAI